MKLEKMCADLEWSKKLGKYFPDAEWWWVSDCYTADTRKYKFLQKKDFMLSTGNVHHWVYGWNPALFSEMILERLPLVRISKIEPLGFECWCHKAENKEGDYLHFSDKKLSNTLVKMFDYCLTNKLIG